MSRIDGAVSEVLAPHTELTKSYGDVCADSHKALVADLDSIKAHYINANAEKHRAVMQGAVKEGTCGPLRTAPPTHPHATGVTPVARRVVRGRRMHRPR